jgi:hypothetical protein
MSYYGFRRFNRYTPNGNNNQIPPSTNGRIDDPDIKNRLEALLANPAVQANSFTLSFVKSLLSQFNTKGFLSQKQFDCISHNESKYDSKIQSAKDDEYQAWCKEYDQEKREKAIKVSNFYKHQHESSVKTGTQVPFYYQKTCENVLLDPNYIPAREAYDKLVNNKFSKRYLENSVNGPKFEAGDIVRLAKTWQEHYKHYFPHEEALVIHVAQPRRNIAGAYIVTILPTGTDRTLEMEERCLKRVKF